MLPPPSPTTHGDVQVDTSAAGHAYSLGQLTVTAEDPYVQAVQAAQPDITPTQPTPTITINSTVTPPPSIQTTLPPTGHRTTYKRVRGYSILSSSLPSPKRTRTTSTGISITPSSLPPASSPAQSPTHSPPHQGPSRASDVHSDDDDEEPQEESEEDPQEEPEEEPATAAPARVELAPVGHILDSACGDKDVGIQ